MNQKIKRKDKKQAGHMMNNSQGFTYNGSGIQTSSEEDLDQI